MASKAVLALALLGTVALVVAGTTLALHITDSPDSVTVTDTLTVAETLTTTVTEAPSASSAPPTLTENGQLVWQLEALLEDTFGTSEFYLHYEDDAATFDTEFTGNCCSESWNFLFPDARGSRLRLEDPGHPLPTQLGASSGALPLKILGRYIACDDSTWLYTGVGNATSPNFYLFCEPV